MIITTKIFGEIEIADEKIITFPSGIVGFPELTKFTLIYNEEVGSESDVKWLQSIDEPAFAMPVMNPLAVMSDYNPVVEEELLDSIGGLNEDNLLVMVTLTVPKDLKKMSINLKAPIIINAETTKGMQVILDDASLEVRFPIYDILNKGKAGEGTC